MPVPPPFGTGGSRGGSSARKRSTSSRAPCEVQRRPTSVDDHGDRQGCGQRRRCRPCRSVRHRRRASSSQRADRITGRVPAIAGVTFTQSAPIDGNGRHRRPPGPATRMRLRSDGHRHHVVLSGDDGPLAAIRRDLRQGRPTRSGADRQSGRHRRQAASATACRPPRSPPTRWARPWSHDGHERGQRHTDDQRRRRHGARQRSRSASTLRGLRQPARERAGRSGRAHRRRVCAATRRRRAAGSARRRVHGHRGSAHIRARRRTPRIATRDVASSTASPAPSRRRPGRAPRRVRSVRDPCSSRRRRTLDAAGVADRHRSERRHGSDVAAGAQLFATVVDANGNPVGGRDRQLRSRRRPERRQPQPAFGHHRRERAGQRAVHRRSRRPPRATAFS